MSPIFYSDLIGDVCVCYQYTGVLGAFNCQGGGWSPEARRNKCASEYSHTVTAKAKPSDIEWHNGRAPIPMVGVRLFAVYSSRVKKLALLKPDEEFEVELDPFSYDLFVVSPVNIFPLRRSIQFAPIGLVNMLNAGGAVQSLEFEDRLSESTVKIAVKGAGEMKAYSSERPAACRVNREDAGFVYEENVVTVEVPWSGSSNKLCIVEYLY